MNQVPKMTYVLPIRRRLTFTTNALPSLILHASRDHEIIIVVDRCPLVYEWARRPAPGFEEFEANDRMHLEGILRWIDSHQPLLDRYNVRVIESYGDERCWTGGLRAAYALNVGVAAASTQWIIGPGDEDCFHMPNWDEVLWRTFGGRDPDRYVASMVMVTAAIYETWPDPMKADWIHSQRTLCTHKLTFPIRPDEDMDTTRITMQSFTRFAELGSLSGVIEEPCGQRSVTHWVPVLMHKSLLQKFGGWSITDHAAFGYDLVLDDAMGAAGVRRRMASDHMQLHVKHYMYISDEVDRVWADPSILAVKGRV